MKEVVNISNNSKAFQGLNLLIKNNDFLLLFLGRLVSSTGSAIFFISILWVTVSKLGGAATVSFILMASAIPSIILSPFAGVWADRWKKKNILVVTDLISGGLLLFLGLFLNVKLFQVWVLFSTVFAIQICSTIFSPALQSLVPSVVEDRSLSQANALISMTNNLSQLVGMAIGGVLISLVGLRAVILLDGISFILSGISEMFIKAEDKKKEKRKLKGIFPDIKDGLKLIWSKVELKGLISLEAIVDFFGTTIFVFIPLLANDILKVGSSGLGFMQTMLGLGALLSTLILSFTIEIERKYLLLSVAVVSSGLCLISIGLFTRYLPALISLFVLGAALNLANINQTIIFQRGTPAELRGRIFAFRSTVNSGIRPFSYGFAGVVATVFPLSNIFVTFGTIIGVIGFFYLLIPGQLQNRDYLEDRSRQ